MKWKLSRPEPAMLVYCYVKLMGLAPFTFKNNKFGRPSILCQLYSALLAFVSIIIAPGALYFMLKDTYASKYSHLVNITGTVHQVAKVLVTFLAITIFSFKHETILDIMNRLCTISKKLESLGIEEDNKKFFERIVVTTAVMNSVLITTCVALIFMERNWVVGLSIKYGIDSWFHSNMVLIFTQVLFFVGQRFRLVNERLSKVFRSPADNLRLLRSSRILVVSRNHHEENQADVIKELTNLQQLRRMEALHLDVCHLVDTTSQLFAVPILLKSFQCLAELLTHLFWIFHTILNIRHHGVTTEITPLLINILCPLLRTAILISQLLGIAHASATTCREGNATKTVLHKVWYKYKSRDLHNELVMFSLQLKHSPVALSVFGVINLDYSYFYQILSALVAYLIIMLQFDTSNSNPGT